MANADSLPQCKHESAGRLVVEVVYALPERQCAVTLDLPAGATARDAALASGLDREFDDLDLAHAPLGIWSKRVADSTPLRPRDRVEIYRRLGSDPREKRRELALRGKTMAHESRS